MLYASTRSKSSVETAHKAIHLDCAGDGGLFTPFQATTFSLDEILVLKDHTFGQNMANMLNHFFSCGLTGWDVEFAIGRSPVKVNTIPHRVLIAESWHNSQWNFDSVVQVLSDRLRKENVGEIPTNWLGVAVRIAAIFGIYGQLLAAGYVDAETQLDVAVTTGDFVGPIAAWYARSMCLPIGNIICGCNANGGVWDLLHHGEMSTGGIAVKTTTPEADVVVPRNLERLVYETLGMEENLRFLACCRKGSMYAVTEEQFEVLHKGMFAAVISDSRVSNIIHSVYRTSNYVFGPYSALAYGSLLDYRAKTGESRPALLLTERGPICNSQLVAKAMQVPVSELMKRINIK